MALVHAQSALVVASYKAIRILDIVAIKKPGIPFDELNSDWLCKIYYCDPDLDPHYLELDPEVKGQEGIIWIREWSDTSIKPGEYRQIMMESRDHYPIFEIVLP